MEVVLGVIGVLIVVGVIAAIAAAVPLIRGNDQPSSAKRRPTTPPPKKSSSSKPESDSRPKESRSGYWDGKPQMFQFSSPHGAQGGDEALPPDWYDDPDGSGDQRWWDGHRWTSRRRTQTQPTNRERQRDQPGTSPPDSQRMSTAKAQGLWTKLPTAGRIAVVTVPFVVLVGIILLVATGQDEASYEAGQDWGARYAGIHNSLSGAGDSDFGITIECTKAAVTATTDGVWINYKRLEADDIDFDDYKQGCFDTARAILPG